MLPKRNPHARIVAGVVLVIPLLCVGCVRYRPAPLDPPALEQTYRSRSLSDPGLLEYVREQDEREWPPATLDLDSLALVASYFSPEMEVARAAARRSEVAARAAGARVNPSASVSGGYDTGPESPVLLESLLSFTIETGGKRASRILLATREAEVARLQVLETAWQVRARVRDAFIGHLVAARRTDLLRDEEAAQSEITDMLERRLEVGEIARPAVDSARQQLASTRTALREAEGKSAQTLAALAASAGLTVAALDDVRFNVQLLDQLRPLDDLPLAEVQRAGLLHRAGVQRALAEYEVAEAAVRVAVARQYPDLEIGPGFIFEESFARYVVGYSSMLPVLNRNRGPIAVAEAERLQAQRRLEQEQARAIEEMETAVAAYRAAFAALTEADVELDAARLGVEAARQALAVGEGDRLTLVEESLLELEGSKSRLDSLEKAQAAFGALENAVQHSLSESAPNGVNQ